MKIAEVSERYGLSLDTLRYHSTSGLVYPRLGNQLSDHTKGEPFKGHDISLNSLSDLIVKLALSPTLEVQHSLGVSRAD
jgi:hypothetical protein